MSLSRTFFRNYAKNFYATKKKLDSGIGVSINKLVQSFHGEIKKKQAFDISSDPELVNDVVNNLKRIVTELKDIREQPLFIKDFPTFNSFWKYLAKENLSIKDLEEINA